MVWHLKKQEILNLSCQRTFWEDDQLRLLSWLTELHDLSYFLEMTKQKVFRKYSKLRKHLPTTKTLFEGPEQKYKSYCRMTTWYHNQNVICYSKGKLVGTAKELVRIKQFSYVTETLAWWIFCTKIGKLVLWIQLNLFSFVDFQ